MRTWTIADSADLYGIPNWGKEFVRINEQGNLVLAPFGDTPRGAVEAPWVDLKELVDDLRRRRIELPLLIRFTDLIKARIDTLATGFATAISEYEYQGRYRGVFPVKVNQQRHVVEDIVRFAAPYHMGLEAGSKPEMLVVTAMLDDPEALIICNGYKDQEYIDTAIMAQKLGRRPIIVIEKSSELDLCIKAAQEHGVRPMLGVRSKLSSRGAGRWEGSTGDRAKFGLTIEEIVDLVDTLREHDMLDCLCLLHFHIGSQVSAIRSIKDAMKEASRIYVELCKLGAPMGYFDAGGGLGVDYDGSSTNFPSSMNYSVQEYAYDIVAALHSACEEAQVRHPCIITESGRALVAHHSVLVVNVMGVSEHPTGEPAVVLTEDDPDVLWELQEALQGVTRKTYQAAWHDAVEARESIIDMFNLGLLDLRQRARGERMFWMLASQVSKVVRDLPYVPDELSGLNRWLADTYFCNFSVFQSIPDSWAVQHLFPVIPIHRHDERPTRQAIIADITCDSDGKIDRFIDLHDVRNTLDLHPPNGQPYYLALFLVGAYQEILGDLHNLFGDTNAVRISIKGPGQYRITEVAEGDTVTDVITYVQFSRRDLVRRVREASERALGKGLLTIEESAHLIARFQSGLDGYTYLQ